MWKTSKSRYWKLNQILGLIPTTSSTLEYVSGMLPPLSKYLVNLLSYFQHTFHPLEIGTIYNQVTVSMTALDPRLTSENISKTQ